MRSSLECVTNRLDWALVFINALEDTGKEEKNGRRFILNYERSNWHSADEWRPVALRHLALAREVLAVDHPGAELLAAVAKSPLDTKGNTP